MTDLPPALARRFPIQQGPSIPWALMVPHARQAQENHNQTFERLAERGGLSPCEALAILEDREWHEIPHEQARQQLIEYLAKHEAALARPAWQPDTRYQLEVLTAARDALAAFGKQAGYLPEQGGYSTTMTQSEKDVAQSIVALDECITSLAAALPPPPTENL